MTDERNPLPEEPTPVIGERERRRRVSDAIQRVMADSPESCSLKERVEQAVKLAVRERDREWIRWLRESDIDPGDLPALKRELGL